MRCVAWMLATAIAISGTTTAQSLPVHTSNIKTLTVEQAKAFAQHEGLLLLDGLTMISDEVAIALAQHEGQLFLDGLTTISDESARALSRHKGGLSLKGLTMLSAKAAKSLAQYKGELTLSEDAAQEGAKALVQFEGIGTQEDVTTPSALPKQPSKLPDAYSLKAIDVETAKRLAASKEPFLMLSNLQSIDEACAKELLRFRGYLYLGSVASLSDEAANALSQHQGGLDLFGLRSVSRESQHKLMEARDCKLNIAELDKRYQAMLAEMPQIPAASPADKRTAAAFEGLGAVSSFKAIRLALRPGMDQAAVEAVLGVKPYLVEAPWRATRDTFRYKACYHFTGVKKEDGLNVSVFFQKTLAIPRWQICVIAAGNGGDELGQEFIYRQHAGDRFDAMADAQNPGATGSLAAGLIDRERIPGAYEGLLDLIEEKNMKRYLRRAR